MTFTFYKVYLTKYLFKFIILNQLMISRNNTVCMGTFLRLMCITHLEKRRYLLLRKFYTAPKTISVAKLARNQETMLLVQLYTSNVNNFF